MALNQQNPQRAIEQALACHRAGQLAEAEAIYRQILARNPYHADALNLLGLLAHQVGRHEAALELIGNAIHINGSVPAYHNNLGLAQRASGRSADAVTSFKRAVSLDPDYAEAHSNLGNAYQDLGQLDDAAACYRRALSLRPDLAEIRANLAHTLHRQSRIAEAIACYREALAGRPDRADILNNLGNALRDAGEMEEAIACYQRSIALQPGYPTVHDTLLCSLSYVDSSTPEDILVAHRRYAAQFEAPLKPTWAVHDNPRDPDRRLKIGYVSADFFNHSVAYFIEPILAHHDRTRFEIHAYYNRAAEDETTARLKSLVDHWIPCRSMSDAQLAERIRADGIDILVDLAGHTDGNRLLAFARKPAPVQMTYLGYPATTGLSAMDYRLTTLDTDPEGAEAWHSERLFRLPRTLWCYRPPSNMPAAVPETPARKRGFITFGSMNNFSKVSARTIALWGEILRALPDARLVVTNLAGDFARAAVRARFADRGIDTGRLSLHARVPADRFRSIAGEIDIALDPFPYAGTTTTCEALWMGIPVITLIGKTSAARSGYALLKGAGLDELCARGEAEYAEIALALARDFSRLDRLRRGIRPRIEASPLRDERQMARDIEGAYRAVWKAWCRS
jgi:protein O-GlcNAc transferase